MSSNAEFCRMQNYRCLLSHARCEFIILLEWYLRKIEINDHMLTEFVDELKCKLFRYISKFIENRLGR